MTQAILNKQDIKFVTDSLGRKKEVLLNYKKFQQIIEILDAQLYFESYDVQERLKKADEDIRNGRYFKVKGNEIEKGLKWLNE